MEKSTLLLCIDDKERLRLISDTLCEAFNIRVATSDESVITTLSEEQGNISALLICVDVLENGHFLLLRKINRANLIKPTPVIVLCNEGNQPGVAKALKFGAFDYMLYSSTKPLLVNRIYNVIMAFSERQNLEDKMLSYLFTKERDSAVIVSIFSNAIERQNGESRLHVLHVNKAVELILNIIPTLDDSYSFTKEEISTICLAASMHDIGKIAIPQSILNKPGRLTPEEFEKIKTHTTLGYEIIESMPQYRAETITKYCREIVRWHHEKYDGKGYPDGLKGYEIPIYFQAVSLADCYDSLISERVYKKAIEHNIARQMIIDGECGQFNPLILKAFEMIEETLYNTVTELSLEETSIKRARETYRDTFKSFAESNT